MLKDHFSSVTAHDFPDNVSEGIRKHPEHSSLFDADALKKKYDLVIASNVLNVQPSRDALKRTLDDIYCSMKVGARVMANIPRDPIKYPAKNFSEMVKVIRREMAGRFGDENVSSTRKSCGRRVSSVIFEAPRCQKTDASSNPDHES